ncbi:MAG: hypothetical protein ACPG7E_01495 [Marinirhabdus sp.]
MKKLYCFAVFILVLGCSPKGEESGGQIVKKAIAAHGGIENFKALDSVSIEKTTRLFTENGTLESETVQFQKFVFNSKKRIEISWGEGTAETEIISTGNSTFKFVEDRLVTGITEIEAAERAVAAAEYVFFQPFKFMVDGATFEYLGTQKIKGGTAVKKVRVYYGPDSNPTDDVWHYFFDKKYRLAAAQVKHNGRSSFIENLAFQRYKGLLFNKHRKSFFVDSLGRKLYLRAEYFYKITP